MLKKLISFIVMSFAVLFSFSFAVNVNQWGFGDAGRTSWIWVSGTWTSQWENFIEVVKGIVNWILWILALITLIILLWGGFQMVTAAWDDGKYKKWFTILKQAAVWLIFIWVSWFVVSIIFAVITRVTNW